MDTSFEINSKYFQLKKEFPWMNQEIYHIIMKESRKQYCKIPMKLDFPKLICSVITAESGEFCNNNYERMLRVRSVSNALGIMQLMVKYYAPKNPESLYNPEINVQKGVMYLTVCLQKSIKEGHKNPIQIACAYYNAGSNCKLWRYNNWGYVNKIQKYYRI